MLKLKISIFHFFNINKCFLLVKLDEKKKPFDESSPHAVSL